jgi:ferrous iron transport protein A
MLMATEKTQKEAMFPLALLSPGEKGCIAQLRGGAEMFAESKGVEGAQRLEELGLRIGKSVEMLRSGAGPILLRVEESRIALARGLAMKIMVRRQL